MNQASEFHNLEKPEGGIVRELAPGPAAHIFTGEGAMLSIVTIAPNAAETLHSHPEEQWGVMLEGTAIRVQGGAEFAVSKGDFWRTPRRRAPHGARRPRRRTIARHLQPAAPRISRSGTGFGTM